MPDTSTRRQFLATASAGAAFALTATSYARIVGANERLSIGLIGCGGRGFAAHMPGVHAHDKPQNVEFIAVMTGRAQTYRIQFCRRRTFPLG